MNINHGYEPQGKPRTQIPMQSSGVFNPPTLLCRDCSTIVFRFASGYRKPSLTNNCLQITRGFFLTIFLIFCQQIFSQTFTNNTVTASGWGTGTLTKTIAVSGLPVLADGTFELTEFDIHMGRQADGTYNYSYYSVRITSPMGTTVIVVNGQGYAGSWTFPNGNVREFNCKFRDNQYLQFPSGGSGSLSEPWHIGYYRSLNADAFSVFNGEDPNGNWTVTIIETSVSSGARFNSASLIFRPSLVVTDYTSFTDNNNCSTPYCLRGSEIVIGTNNSFSNQSDDMYNPNTSGCVWNAAQNNSAWFKFVAASTSVRVTISGITGSLQILGISSTGNQCTASNNTVVSGGCPEDAVNDTYISQRYSNGSVNNNQLNMSGLTIGNTYYIIVDGTGGSISPFYIEISGAEDGACNDILPVEMSGLKAECTNEGVLISWKTLSEINNDYFTVYKSANGMDFSEIAVIEGAGNSSEIISYYYQDRENQYNTAYYIIRQTDYDGKESYSKTVTTRCASENEILVINNPSENCLIVKFPPSENRKYSIRITDHLGRNVYNNQAYTNQATSSLSIDKSYFSKGIYYLSVISENEFFSKQVLICRE